MSIGHDTPADIIAQLQANNAALEAKNKRMLKALDIIDRCPPSDEMSDEDFDAADWEWNAEFMVETARAALEASDE